MSDRKYCQEMFHFQLPSIMLQSTETFGKNLKLNIAMLRLFN